jgi:ankyrin repeat protein
LRASAKFLLEAGADPNQAAGSRWPPASLSEPSETFRLSALYGAAGQNHDPELTRLLLEAGADPNDNESLYHSLENQACTRLLLDAGARIAGSNALYHVLDLDGIDALRSCCRAVQTQMNGHQLADGGLALAAAVGDQTPTIARSYFRVTGCWR